MKPAKIFPIVMITASLLYGAAETPAVSQFWKASIKRDTTITQQVTLEGTESDTSVSEEEAEELFIEKRADSVFIWIKTDTAVSVFGDQKLDPQRNLFDTLSLTYFWKTLGEDIKSSVETADDEPNVSIVQKRAALGIQFTENSTPEFTVNTDISIEISIAGTYLSMKMDFSQRSIKRYTMEPFTGKVPLKRWPSKIHRRPVSDFSLLIAQALKESRLPGSSQEN